MANSRSRVVARLLWIFPAILLILTINQILVAVNLRNTMSQGDEETARVLAIETTDRADITMASVRLRVPMEQGAVERDLPMPITFARQLREGQDVNVLVNPGSDQEIVIAEFGRAQWRLAAVNSGMGFIALALFAVGVFAWNRYLDRKGDPADRQVDRADTLYRAIGGPG